MGSREEERNNREEGETFKREVDRRGRGVADTERGTQLLWSLRTDVTILSNT